MKQLQQGGELTLPGRGTGAPLRAAIMARAQQVPTSLSRTSFNRQAGSAEGRQRLLRAGVLMSRAGGSQQVAGRNPNGSSKFTPKGCTPRRRLLAELREISNPLTGIGGAHLHLYKPGLSSKFTEL